MINKNVFCARKGGATINGKFYPLQTSDILSRQIERDAKKMACRDLKRRAKR